MVNVVAGEWTHYGPSKEESALTMFPSVIEDIKDDCRKFARIARDSKLGEIHVQLGLTWAEFCVKRLRNEPDVVDAIIAGVNVLLTPLREPVHLTFSLRLYVSFRSVSQSFYSINRSHIKGDTNEVYQFGN